MKYLLSEAAMAADNTAVATVRSWVQRGHITFEGEDMPKEVQGLPHAISLASAIRLAITVRLTKNRAMTPGMAWKMARRFTHAGTGGAGWVGEASTAPARNPCQPFDDGRTVLLCIPQTEKSEVLRIDDETSAMRLVELSSGAEIILLDLTDLTSAAEIKLDMLAKRRSFGRARSLGEKVPA